MARLTKKGISDCARDALPSVSLKAMSQANRLTQFRTVVDMSALVYLRSGLAQKQNPTVEY
jgi:hypothetical protein